MQNVQLKKVAIEEVEQLKDISIQTFHDTFSESNSKEDMEKYLEVNFTIEKLSTELENINSTFYFAILDSKVIGYLKLNIGEAQTEPNKNNALEIERIYILKEFQGMKIGQLLLDHAIQIATAKKIDYIWLGVWEKNFQAIKFYTKNSFVEFDTHIFMFGNDKQTDILMKLALV